MRKIIIPVSYMASGSSAFTNFIHEFANVSNEYNNWEYVFLHCPNGLFDLEDKLLIGNNILRSDEALHSFLKCMKELYDKKYWWVGNYKEKIGKEFYHRCEKFVNDLTDFKIEHYWYYTENPNFKMFMQLIWRKILKIITFNKIVLKKPRLYPELYLSYPSPDKFYKLAKEFIYDVLNMIDNTNQDILVDQLILPYNLFRIDKYFDDNVKFIVVERDPRDVFLENKYSKNAYLAGLGIPYSINVEDFCKQFRKIKEMEKKVNNNNILRINFEDLIYYYDDTKERIIKFLGFENREHILYKKCFDPDISIKNTQLFKNKKYEKEAKYMEKHLKEYLYDFPM